MKDTKKVCSYCGKTFRSGQALGGHIKIHTKKVSHKKTMKKTSLQQRFCRICGKRLFSLKSHHCHSNTQSDTEMKQSDSDSDSESFSNGNSSEIDQEVTNAALILMKMSLDSTFNQLESADDNGPKKSPECKRASDSNAPIVHKCPICLGVFESVKALHDHKRSHSSKGQGQTSQMPKPFDLNLPYTDSDE